MRKTMGLTRWTTWSFFNHYVSMFSRINRTSVLLLIRWWPDINFWAWRLSMRLDQEKMRRAQCGFNYLAPLIYFKLLGSVKTAMSWGISSSLGSPVLQNFKGQFNSQLLPDAKTMVSVSKRSLPREVSIRVEELWVTRIIALRVSGPIQL